MERSSFSSLPTLEAGKNENKAAIVSGGQRAAAPLGQSEWRRLRRSISQSPMPSFTSGLIKL